MVASEATPGVGTSATAVTGAATALATPFADGEAAGSEETEAPEETEIIEEEYTGAHIRAEESEPEAEEPLPEDLPEELIEEQPEEPLPEPEPEEPEPTKEELLLTEIRDLLKTKG